MVESTSSMTSDYDAHSTLQMEANARNLEPLAEALLAAARPGEPLTLADFGSATGLNSMKTFTKAIRQARTVSQAEVFVLHVDLPSNSWDVLFNNALTSEHSYLNLPGTFVSGIGRSNFDRLFPSNFLSVGYSTFSLHWLSRRSVSKQQLKRFCESEAEMLNELRDIAREDWERFLTHRTEELKPGGRLIVQSPVSKLELDAFYQALAGMAESGACSAESLDSFAIPWCLRSEEEFLASIPKFRQLRVVSQVVSELPDPFYRKLQEDGDMDVYVKTIIQSSRVATENLFRELFKNTDNAAELIEDFYARVGAYLRDHAHPIHTRQLVLVLEKVAA